MLLEAAELLGTADLALTVIGSDGFDPEAPLSAFEDRLRQTAPGLASPVRFLLRRPTHPP
ncbi:hypothetical protein [Nesterenkonia pannonica]|uniref:hypothetical protein n=1 Tax=Nesterenkonia pannonica TaxID=1548602 RepID=UPI002164CC81|nr:hypothetical protein [Nesterenkonia pannonica]